MPEGLQHPNNAIVVTGLHGASPKPIEYSLGTIATGHDAEQLAGKLVQFDDVDILTVKLAEAGTYAIGFLEVLPDKRHDVPFVTADAGPPIVKADRLKVVMGECIMLAPIAAGQDISAGDFLEPANDGYFQAQTTGMCVGQALEDSNITACNTVLVHFFKCPPPASQT